MGYLMEFKTYKDFNNFNQKMLILESVRYESNFNNIFFELLNKSNHDIKIKNEVLSFISLNESIFSNIKNKMTDVKRKLSDKAYSLLTSLIQKSNDILSLVKSFTNSIRELFKNLILSSKEYFLKELKIGELKDKIHNLETKNKEGLITDLKSISEVLEFYRKKFINNFSESIEKNLSVELAEAPNESIKNSKDILSNLIHGIEKIPPFSYLHSIAHNAESGINYLISGLSKLTKAMGGPEFQLPVISLLLALCIEYLVKSTTGHWLLEMVGPSPIGMVIKGIKITATCIALFSAIDAIFNAKLLHH